MMGPCGCPPDARPRTGWVRGGGGMGRTSVVKRGPLRAFGLGRKKERASSSSSASSCSSSLARNRVGEGGGGVGFLSGSELRLSLGLLPIS